MNAQVTPKPKRSGVPVNFYMPAPLRKAFDAYLDSLDPRPTDTAAFNTAVREMLAKRGFWPPPADA